MKFGEWSFVAKKFLEFTSYPGQAHQMEEEVIIKLSRLDVGQLIDGLQVRLEAWRATQLYLETGEFPSGDFSIEDATDAEEAEQIADHYERIILSITQQVKLQRAR